VDFAAGRPWFHGSVSLFPWALIFLGLCIAGAGLLALVGLGLWRNVKTLGRDAGRLGDSLSSMRGPDSRGGYDPGG
jgi:hypothetical protein